METSPIENDWSRADDEKYEEFCQNGNVPGEKWAEMLDFARKLW